VFDQVLGERRAVNLSGSAALALVVAGGGRGERDGRPFWRVSPDRGPSPGRPHDSTAMAGCVASRAVVAEPRSREDGQ
jgi:hypothetical protein